MNSRLSRSPTDSLVKDTQGHSSLIRPYSLFRNTRPLGFIMLDTRMQLNLTGN